MSIFVVLLMQGIYRDALAIQRCYITNSDFSTKFEVFYLWYNPCSQYLPDFLLSARISIQSIRFLQNLFNPIKTLKHPFSFNQWSTTVLSVQPVISQGFPNVCTQISRYVRCNKLQTWNSYFRFGQSGFTSNLVLTDTRWLMDYCVCCCTATWDSGAS